MRRWSQLCALCLLAWPGLAEAGGRRQFQGFAPGKQLGQPRAVDSLSCSGDWGLGTGNQLLVPSAIPPAQISETVTIECTFTGTPPIAPGFSLSAVVNNTGAPWDSYVEVGGLQWTQDTFGTSYPLGSVSYTSNPQSWGHTAVFDIPITQAPGQYTFTIIQTITAI